MSDMKSMEMIMNWLATLNAPEKDEDGVDTPGSSDSPYGLYETAYNPASDYLPQNPGSMDGGTSSGGTPDGRPAMSSLSRFFDPEIKVTEEQSPLLFGRDPNSKFNKSPSSKGGGIR
tara:strand:- start:228 stop:578 length:351 start_codon:yes stop_codon:yes gene_type:complete